MKTYKVKTQFRFDGYFYVNADTPFEAVEQVENHANLVYVEGIETTSDQILSWEFDVYPDKIVRQYNVRVDKFNVMID